MRIQLLSNVWRYLRDKRVRFSTKLVYVLTVLIYGFAPDFLPFLPFDDIVVIWVASIVFTRVARRETGNKDNIRPFKRKDDPDIIDTEGKIIE